MRSRSDVARSRADKKPESGTKPSAAERTETLPKVDPSARVQCGLCHATPTVEQLQVRADGTKECPECGNTIDDFSPVKGTPATEPKPTRPTEEAKLTGTHYCIECGSEWPTLNGKPFPNCGHSGHAVEDPRLAKKIDPPAGLQERVLSKIRELDAADEKLKQAVAAKKPETSVKPKEESRSDRSDLAKPARIPTTELAGELLAAPLTNRISIPWGKSRCPVDRFNYFEVGGFIVTYDLREGEDRVEATSKILDDLEKMANEAFDRQEKWYAKKLGKLGGPRDD